MDLVRVENLEVGKTYLKPVVTWHQVVYAGTVDYGGKELHVVSYPGGRNEAADCHTLYQPAPAPVQSEVTAGTDPASVAEETPTAEEEPDSVEDDGDSSHTHEPEKKPPESNVAEPIPDVTYGRKDTPRYSRTTGERRDPKFVQKTLFDLEPTHFTLQEVAVLARHDVSTISSWSVTGVDRPGRKPAPPMEYVGTHEETKLRYFESMAKVIEYILQYGGAVARKKAAENKHFSDNDWRAIRGALRTLQNKNDVINVTLTSILSREPASRLRYPSAAPEGFPLPVNTSPVSTYRLGEVLEYVRKKGSNRLQQIFKAFPNLQKL